MIVNSEIKLQSHWQSEIPQEIQLWLQHDIS